MMYAPAKTLLRHAMRKHGDPLSITLDAYAASHRAVQELKDSGEIFYQKMRVRSCAYLNNVAEQDYRRVKRRVQPVLEFKNIPERTRGDRRNRVCRKIKKQQYDLRRLGGVQASHAEMWQRTMAA